MNIKTWFVSAMLGSITGFLLSYAALVFDVHDLKCRIAKSETRLMAMTDECLSWTTVIDTLSDSVCISWGIDPHNPPPPKPIRIWGKR